MSGKNILINHSSWPDHVKPILLFICVSVYVFVVPLLPENATKSVSFILILIILAQTVFVLKEGGKKLFLLLFIVWLIQVGSGFINMTILYYVSKFTTNLFFIYVVFLLIGEILRTREVSGLTILDAGTGYLLLGIAYTGFVEFIIRLDPEAYRPVLASFEDMKYFTFVTFTTVGYGDITPVTQLAKTLTMIISVSGQFYIGVIIAILVGKFSSRLR